MSFRYCFQHKNNQIEVTILPFLTDNKVVNKIDEKGLTPILWAASYGQLASIQTLYQHGANIHFKGATGENALMLAASNGHLAVIKHLISLGIDLDETDEV